MTEAQVAAHIERTKRAERSSVPPAAPQTSIQRLRALGRLKTGEMNDTERRYADHLETRKLAGEVIWYEFEAIKLKLADNTHLTVDFSVMLADGQLEMHDCKGSKAIYQDDAKVKMKWAAQRYPFVFRAAFPKSKKDGGGWLVEEV